MITANVLDLYHGDNRDRTPDFAALRINGIFGIIHKSSEGMHFIDAQYSVRRQPAQDAGLLWGAYHFLTSAASGADQADFFLNSAKPDANTLLACDYEKSRATPTLQQCLDFMSYVDANAPGQIRCVIYSSDLIRETLRPIATGGHQSDAMKGAEMFFAQHRLWLAEYGPHPNVPWPWNDKSLSRIWQQPFLWQFKDTGRVNPIVGNVDLNYYPGDFETLKANWPDLQQATPNPAATS
jgi:GH25 family lysozyme M1 (1,4-beta-N-acetylmuramidase)